MTSYNRTFELDIEELDIIEKALFSKMQSSDKKEEVRFIHELLGKLHNQKKWYRPEAVYVGG